jgi:peptidoglycan hydrolase-like protein with peptidoglycan-binding domain
MSLQRVWIPSPNYSSRGGSAVRLIVLHTAEGCTTLESLGNFFASSSSGVSSHTGIDDKRGKIGEYVSRGNKAWTQGNANPVCVATEICGFASWSESTWRNSHPNMLYNAADWVKEEAAKYGIPITKLTASQAQGGSKGVCQHRDLGSWGGGHSDCGNGFPMDYVLDLARGGSPAPPSGGGGSTSGKAPTLHVDYFGTSHNSTCPDVQVWQAQMSGRGWSIDVDGDYGPASDNVCRQFQSEKGISVDGQVGPDTWEASWSAPVT